MESYGERIRRLRTRKGLSIRQLEDMAGIPHGVISRVERERRKYTSIPHAMSLARVLGVSLDYLTGMHEEWDAGDSSKRACPVIQIALESVSA